MTRTTLFWWDLLCWFIVALILLSLPRLAKLTPYPRFTCVSSTFVLVFVSASLWHQVLCGGIDLLGWVISIGGASMMSGISFLLQTLPKQKKAAFSTE